MDSTQVQNNPRVSPEKVTFRHTINLHRNVIGLILVNVRLTFRTGSMSAVYKISDNEQNGGCDYEAFIRDLRAAYESADTETHEVKLVDTYSRNLGCSCSAKIMVTEKCLALGDCIIINRSKFDFEEFITFLRKVKSDINSAIEAENKNKSLPTPTRRQLLGLPESDDDSDDDYFGYS
jgi:hypothetical protein